MAQQNKEVDEFVQTHDWKAKIRSLLDNMRQKTSSTLLQLQCVRHIAAIADSVCHVFPNRLPEIGTSELFRTILKTMRSHAKQKMLQVSCCRLLFIVCWSPDNAQNLIREGGLPRVLASMSDYPDVVDLQKYACKVLMNLFPLPPETELHMPATVSAFLRALHTFQKNEESQITCLFPLLRLCAACERVAMEVLRQGGFSIMIRCMKTCTEMESAGTLHSVSCQILSQLALGELFCVELLWEMDTIAAVFISMQVLSDMDRENKEQKYHEAIVCACVVISRLYEYKGSREVERNRIPMLMQIIAQYNQHEQTVLNAIRTIIFTMQCGAPAAADNFPPNTVALMLQTLNAHTALNSSTTLLWGGCRILELCLSTCLLAINPQDIKDARDFEALIAHIKQADDSVYRVCNRHLSSFLERKGVPTIVNMMKKYVSDDEIQIRACSVLHIILIYPLTWEHQQRQNYEIGKHILEGVTTSMATVRNNAALQHAGCVSIHEYFYNLKSECADSSIVAACARALVWCLKVEDESADAHSILTLRAKACKNIAMLASRCASNQALFRSEEALPALTCTLQAYKGHVEITRCAHEALRALVRDNDENMEILSVLGASIDQQESLSALSEDAVGTSGSSEMVKNAVSRIVNTGHIGDPVKCFHQESKVQSAAGDKKPPKKDKNVKGDGSSSAQEACVKCGKTAADMGLKRLLRCSACALSPRYCSAKCQRASWPAHKAECKANRPVCEVD